LFFYQNLQKSKLLACPDIVIAPKYRQKVLYGKLKRDLGDILRDLCRQKGVNLVEGHLMPDHVHMCLRVPPKHSIAFVIGFLKGKSAVRIHRRAGNKRVTGLHFWAKGYCVSTVGLDEATVANIFEIKRRLINNN